MNARARTNTHVRCCAHLENGPFSDGNRYRSFNAVARTLLSNLRVLIDNGITTDTKIAPVIVQQMHVRLDMYLADAPNLPSTAQGSTQAKAVTKPAATAGVPKSQASKMRKKKNEIKEETISVAQMNADWKKELTTALDNFFAADKNDVLKLTSDCRDQHLRLSVSHAHI